MRPSESLTVPQPCAQSWAAMSPVESGRHCAACEKTVVDFTRHTTAEIRVFLAQPGCGSVCGRFRASQLPQPQRLLTWRAAPRLALSVAAVLTLTHCTPDQPMPPTPAAPAAKGVQAGVVTRGRLLDRTTRQPLVGALVLCEADTLCQTRTAADGTFALAVPPHLAHGKLIAVMPERSASPAGDEEYQMPYLPHYFTAGADVTVLLRRPPLVLGQTKLEPGETYAPVVRQYLVRCGAVPPPPKLITIKFAPPAPTNPSH